MTEWKRLDIERMLLNESIARIEIVTGKMFHELQPETDREIHELAYNNRHRLRIIRIALEQEYSSEEILCW